MTFYSKRASPGVVTVVEDEMDELRERISGPEVWSGGQRAGYPSLQERRGRAFVSTEDRSNWFEARSMSKPTRFPRASISTFTRCRDRRCRGSSGASFAWVSSRNRCVSCHGAVSGSAVCELRENRHQVAGNAGHRERIPGMEATTRTAERPTNVPRASIAGQGIYVPWRFLP